MARASPQLGVAQVAPVVAGATDAGVGDDDRAPRDRQHVVDGRGRGVREVDQHAPRLQAGDPLAALRGQPALADAVRGAADVGVEEVRGGHHAEAGVGQHVHVREVALERVRALEPEERPDRATVARAPRDETVEVGGGADEGEPAPRPPGGALQPLRLVERAGAQAAPGGGRPA
jgi:hypothetical protein